ncbi:MAG: hypothetical protein J3Q66DRAFT_353203 [Benniella sp.]|nr:MAG: hypothetical protein J3Q66DRAFT_353203 [Benniella sp.]
MTASLQLSRIEYLIRLIEIQTLAQQAVDRYRLSPDETLLAKANEQLCSFSSMQAEAIRLGYRSVPARLVFNLPRPLTHQGAGPRTMVAYEEIDWDTVPRLVHWTGTRHDADCFLSRMSSFRARHTYCGERILDVIVERQIWVQGIFHLGDKVSEPLRNMALASTWYEMENIFRDWFVIPGSTRSLDLRNLAWDEVKPLGHFCLMFKDVMRRTGLSLTDRAIRETMAELFMVHIPRSWPQRSSLLEDDRAPELDALIYHVQVLALDHPIKGSGLRYDQMDSVHVDVSGHFSRYSSEQSENESMNQGQSLSKKRSFRKVNRPSKRQRRAIALRRQYSDFSRYSPEQSENESMHEEQSMSKQRSGRKLNRPSKRQRHAIALREQCGNLSRSSPDPWSEQSENESEFDEQSSLSNRERRAIALREHLCFYCGGSDHYRRHCPERAMQHQSKRLWNNDD